MKDPFVYQRPTEAQVESMTRIREAARALHQLLADLCPPGRDSLKAMDHARAAVMWGNAAIVLGE